MFKKKKSWALLFQMTLKEFSFSAWGAWVGRLSRSPSFALCELCSSERLVFFSSVHRSLPEGHYHLAFQKHSSESFHWQSLSQRSQTEGVNKNASKIKFPAKKNAPNSKQSLPHSVRMRGRTMRHNLQRLVLGIICEAPSLLLFSKKTFWWMKPPNRRVDAWHVWQPEHNHF